LTASGAITIRVSIDGSATAATSLTDRSQREPSLAVSDCKRANTGYSTSCSGDVSRLNGTRMML
jgi:hypothetical protein